MSPAAVSAPLLRLEGVTRRFAVRRGLWAARGSLLAVNDVSLDLAPGESLGLVGESGCGKSTLGRLACGLLPPTTGRVLLEGRPLPPGGRSQLGRRAHPDGFSGSVFLPQSPFDRTGFSVRAPGRPGRARAERHARAAAMLATVGLEGAGGRYPHQFSGGQRQRVAVARALVTEPLAVVCDEPVSALDASVQAQVLNLLCDVPGALRPSLPVYFARPCRSGFSVHPCGRHVSGPGGGRGPRPHPADRRGPPLQPRSGGGHAGPQRPPAGRRTAESSGPAVGLPLPPPLS